MAQDRLKQPKSGASSAKTTPADSIAAVLQPDAIGEMIQLQSMVGNRAAIQLANSGLIQLGRKKKRGGNKGGGNKSTPTVQQTTPEEPKLSKEEIKKRIIAGQKRRAEEKKAKNSWGSWFASWIPGGTYEAPKEEEEEDEEDGDSLKYGDTEIEGEDSTFTGEMDLGKEEEAEEEGVKNPFAIEQIEFDLGTGKLEKKDTSLGNIKAEGSESIGGDQSYNLGGKGSIEGQYGKAEGEGKMKMTTDNLEGEGKVAMFFGGTSEQKTGTLGWGIGGHKLEGSGALESKVGLSTDLATKLSLSSEKFAAEGKMGAFLGALSEGSVNVKLKSNGKDLGSAVGKLGIAYGAGGELKGTIKWEGGQFEFGWSGKLVAGIGFSYGYKLTLNTNAVAQTMTGWLPTVKYWLWDAWTLPEDMDFDDIIIF